MQCARVTFWLKRRFFGKSSIRDVWAAYRTLVILLLTTLVYFCLLSFSTAHFSVTPKPINRQMLSPAPPVKVRAEMSNTLGSVRNLAELQQWCRGVDQHQLSPVSSKWSTGDGILQSPTDVLLKYPILSVPVCVTDGGVYIATSKSNTDNNISAAVALLAEKNIPTFFQDAFGNLFDGNSRAFAIPAVGLVTFGPWIATHMVHLMHDLLEGLYNMMTSYGDGILWKVPTQTVLMYGGRASEWRARPAATAKDSSVLLSADILNGFSSPRLTGPFFTSSPRVDFSTSPGGSTMLAQNLINKGATGSVYCFCQALLVTPSSPSFVDKSTYSNMQDVVNNAQFSEAPRHPEATAWDEEQARLKQHSWAARFWQDTGSAALSLGRYKPRVLFIHRRERTIASAKQYAQMLRDEGFRVEEVYMEEWTVAQQYHLGRFADVVVGMHGLALAHAAWMTRFPSGCRTVIEFMPWVHTSMPIQLKHILHTHLGFAYHAVQPIDVSFGSNILNPQRERERLLDARYAVSAFSFPSFTQQTTTYDDAAVEVLFRQVRDHLSTCLG